MPIEMPSRICCFYRNCTEPVGLMPAPRLNATAFWCVRLTFLGCHLNSPIYLPLIILEMF